MHLLRSDYFEQDTLHVAEDLVGALLVHEREAGGRLVGRIVETEAYTQDDPAFHGWGLRDEETGCIPEEGRGAMLYEAPGTGYVYKCYGIHWLLNVVTEPQGTGGAVLIRAVEPLEGRSVMRELRGRDGYHLTNGPGKLTEAFDVDDAYHGEMLTKGPLYFAQPAEREPLPVARSSRIGITKGVERPWRFFVEGHPYVSRGTPSAQK